MVDEPFIFEIGNMTFTLPAPLPGCTGYLLGNEKAMYYSVDLQGNVKKLDEPIRPSSPPKDTPVPD